MRPATDRAHAADRSTVAWEARPSELADGVPDFQRRGAAMLAGGAVLVFVVLVANVASLLLVRFSRRGGEFGLLSALGASRSRLLRQVFAETCVLGACGGITGVGVALEVLTLARARLPSSFFTGSLNPLTLDVRTLAVAGASSIVAVAISGLLPAMVATRPAPGRSLMVSERARTESRHVRRLMQALLIGEVAFACTLLVGATVLVRTFRNLSNADRGFDPRGLVTVWLDASRIDGGAPAQRALITSAERAVRSLAGVQRMAVSEGVALSPAAWSFYHWKIDIPGATPATGEPEVESGTAVNCD